MMMMLFLLLLQGSSLDAQTQRLSHRRDKLLPQLHKLLLTLEAPDDSSKVPGAIREKMEMKVSPEPSAGAWAPRQVSAGGLQVT